MNPNTRTTMRSVMSSSMSAGIVQYAILFCAVPDVVAVIAVVAGVVSSTVVTPAAVRLQTSNFAVEFTPPMLET